MTRNELGEAEETRNRSIYVKNLPPSTQEGLLQQAFEKLVPVKRVEVFLDRNEAIIELQSPAVCAFCNSLFEMSHNSVLGRRQAYAEERANRIRREYLGVERLCASKEHTNGSVQGDSNVVQA